MAAARVRLRLRRRRLCYALARGLFPETLAPTLQWHLSHLARRSSSLHRGRR
ncbi:NADH dehydrogenase subunit 2 [Corchorus olitorius]|uniref:NADH dehydrogenase subunit 2 n=1 Tax=Corchorus olitorius TaxID=93759 RepID=A0A1R3H456_9ROSI|nr:NADH dehydrogenase subunit 2 [Corchorus olitorius]